MLPSSTADTRQRIDPSDEKAALLAALANAGGPLAAALDQEGLWVVAADALPSTPPARGTLVVPLAGGLGPTQADVLDRFDRIVFAADRGEGKAVSDWEARIIAAFQTRAAILPSCADLQTEIVCSFDQIPVMAQHAEAVARAAGAPRSAQEAVTDVVHELLANALLDAPADGEGVPRYAHRRDEHPVIALEDGCRLLMGTEEGRMYVSVTDRFGRFERAPIVRTVRGLGGRARVDASGGGAGLGLRRVIDHSEVFAVRVIAQRASEVLSVVSLEDQRRRSMGKKSLYYRIERG